MKKLARYNIMLLLSVVLWSVAWLAQGAVHLLNTPSTIVTIITIISISAGVASIGTAIVAIILYLDQLKK